MMMDVYDLWQRVAKWSTATFGDPKERGPAGPLNHLKEEIEEVIADPKDIIEYADCLFLIMDAARRAGYGFPMLMKAVDLKLDINMAREWPKPTSPDAVVNHVRS